MHLPKGIIYQDLVVNLTRSADSCISIRAENQVLKVEEVNHPPSAIQNMILTESKTGFILQHPSVLTFGFFPVIRGPSGGIIGST